MKKIAILIGSLRKESYNRALFEAFKKQAPAGLSFEEVSIDLPLLNTDLEDNFPEAATAFKEKVEHADGILIISPEYNRSIPGVLKNALDWGSRPGTTGKNSFNGKKAAIVGATMGGLGTAQMQQHLRSILVYFDMQVMGQPEFYLSGVQDKLQVDGTVTDEKTKSFIDTYLGTFEKFVTS